MLQIPFTVDGIEQLKKELAYLKSVERPQVIKDIAEARSHGDLSENAEYDAAKERQAHIEGKINDLEKKLSIANIINPAEINADGEVVFGSTITIENCDSSEKITYQIVGEYEADLKFKKISITSPLARGLIGKKQGDIAEIKTPNGIKEYEILKVEYI